MKVMKPAPPMGPRARDFDTMLDRLFRSLFPEMLPMKTEALWEPALDLSETEKEVIVRLEVPGFHKENLDVKLEPDRTGETRGPHRAGHPLCAPPVQRPAGPRAAHHGRGVLHQLARSGWHAPRGFRRRPARLLREFAQPDAIAFGVVDNAQARQIYAKIASIPGLRPHDFILPNYPSYDDMYEKPGVLWGFGTWVNGGHWSTCEPRMILGYYRLGQFDDARRSLRYWLTFAQRFRLDNPLVKFGSDVYQPGQPINLTYDALGPPAALVRGLFECLYRADGLTLLPHIPPGITRLEQRFPIRFGAKRLYLATVGAGPVTAVTLNGQSWKSFDPASVSLPYAPLPENVSIEIALGGAQPLGFAPPQAEILAPPVPSVPEKSIHNEGAHGMPAWEGWDRGHFEARLLSRARAGKISDQRSSTRSCRLQS